MATEIKLIKNLVSEFRIEEAIKQLILLLENTNHINQALQISSRFKKEKFNIINGLSDDKTEMNKISYSILELCDELKNYLPEIQNESLLLTGVKDQLDDSLNFYDKFIGLSILNYEIVEYIHAGGFGGVYKAKHNRLGTVYAIKISHEIDEGFEFLDEIMSIGITGLQLLNHKYIVKTYDVGEIVIHGTKRMFIVMEFIDGGTLADLEKQNLSYSEVLNRIEIFKKVCRGIYYSHTLRYTNKLGFQSQGLMHGDIKPANILLTKSFEPRIMDFMFVDMSKLVEIKVKLPQVIEKAAAKTSAFGTDGYMPLEQKIHGIVTERTDIYSLGILLFEILNPVKYSESEFKNPTRRSVAEIHSFLSNNCERLPKFVSKIIYKATQENEFDRYYDVNQIIKDIEKGDPWYQKIFS